MKLKSTLVLFLLVVALGGALWWWEEEDRGTEERIRQARRALKVDPEDVSYFRITSTNLTIACKQIDGQWWIIEPLRCRADKGEIQRILAGLESLPKSDVIAREEVASRGLTYHEYGLALPRANIEIQQNRQRQTILIGDEGAVEGSLYIMDTNRQDIVATSTNLLGLIPGDVSRIRSRRLLSVDSIRIKRLEINRTTGFLQLAKAEDGPWRIEQPVEGRANGLFVQDLANKFFGARIERFVADGEADGTPYGLGENAVKVSMWPADDASPIEIELGDVVEGDDKLVYARTGETDAVYAVPRQLMTEANVDGDILRDRNLLNARMAGVVHIEVRHGEESIEIQKDDAGSWHLVKPSQRPADDDKVWSMLSRWETARINAFLDPARIPTNLVERPPHVLTLSGVLPEGDEPRVEGKQQLTVTVYPPEEEGTGLFRVTLAGESGLFAVSPEVAETLTVQPMAFYDVHVLRLAPADIRSIQLQRGDALQVVQRTEEGAFEPSPDTPGQLVPGAADRRVAEVSDLRAERFVADDPENLGDYGLAEPAALLTLGLTGESGISKSVLIGGEADANSVYAMIRGQESVFVIAKDVRNRLVGDLVMSPSTSTIDRRQPPADHEPDTR